MSEAARANNFSLLRVAFASLVIFSHSFELVDGNPFREPFFNLFGTVTYGALAVDGFFLVSGYLITQSFLTSRPLAYLAKRILRIYPGFIIAFLVSIVLCQWFSGHSLALPMPDLAHNMLNLPFLEGPDLRDPFPGSHFPAPNGSMWTISIEFHCYLLVMVLGALGVLRRRWAVPALACALLLAFALTPDHGFTPAAPHASAAAAKLGHRLLVMTVGDPAQDLRLAGVFLVGAGYFLFRDKIAYRAHWAAAAALLALGCLLLKPLAEPGFAVFGGYCIFWLATHAKVLAISHYFNKTDLSYGLYLYAFPIQKLLIASIPAIQPYTLFAASCAITALAAYCSWTFVEKPCLGLKARFRGTAVLA